MKITAVKSYTVHPGWRKNLIFVKVETDEGMHGWGEAYSQYDRDRAGGRAARSARPYMVGRSPFDIKHFTQFAFRRLRGAPRLGRVVLRDQRHRAGDVGHRRQGVQAARLQPARRALPRQDPRLRERLELRHERAGRLRARRGESRGAGLDRAQARSAAFAVAHVDTEGARGARGARRQSGARSGRSQRRHPHRSAPAARAHARDPARQAARRIRHVLDGGILPGRISRTSSRRSAARSAFRS